MDDEKFIEEIVEEVIGHPKERKEIEDNLYSDVNNELAINKPKYLDPQLQRMQWY